MVCGPGRVVALTGFPLMFHPAGRERCGSVVVKNYAFPRERSEVIYIGLLIVTLLITGFSLLLCLGFLH